MRFSLEKCSYGGKKQPNRTIQWEGGLQREKKTHTIIAFMIQPTLQLGSMCPCKKRERKYNHILTQKKSILQDCVLAPVPLMLSVLCGGCLCTKGKINEWPVKCETIMKCGSNYTQSVLHHNVGSGPLYGQTVDFVTFLSSHSCPTWTI